MTAIQQAFPEGDTTNSTIVAKLAEQGIIVVNDLDAITAEDFTVQPWAGICNQADSALYMYDAADTTSAHDGSTVVVVSGRRYILQNQVIPDAFVVSVGLASPPSSLSLGDQYVIGSAPTGDWASKAENVATWSRRGWIFRSPQRGQIVWNNSDNAFYHYSSGSEWVSGLGIGAIPNGSITPLKARHPFGVLVVAGVQDDPPSSIPSDGAAYIVGSAPTGVWQGEADKVAYVDNGAYVFIAAFEGASVYNQDQGQMFTYRSGAWVVTVEPPSVTKMERVFQDTGANVTGGRTVVGLTINRTGQAGNYWRLEIYNLDWLYDRVTGTTAVSNYELQVALDGASTELFVLNTGTIDSFTGTETVSITGRFIDIEIPDNLPHDIQFRIYRSSGENINPRILDRNSLIYISEVNLS